MITIYLDLDGVVANFKDRFISLYGDSDYKDPTQVESRIDTTKNKEKFNNFVANGNFATLELLPNAQKLLDYLININDNVKIKVEILSSLGRAENLEKVYKDKSKWLDNNNIPFARNFVTSKKYKRNFANCKSILIDDHVGNIEQFVSDGGIGILYSDNNYDTIIKEINFQVNKLKFSGEVYPELPVKKLVYSREEKRTKLI